MAGLKTYTGIGRGLPQSMTALLTYVSRHYAAILFCDSPALGLMLLAITFTIPNIGIAGFIALMSAYLFALRFNFLRKSSATVIHGAASHVTQKNDKPIQEPLIYNSLLLGLSLGSLYQLNAQLVLLIVIGAVFSVMLTQFLANLLWRAGHLPVLSLPFVLMTWLTWLSAKSMSGLQALSYTWPVHGMDLPGLSGVFKTLGLFFFIPYPLAGLLMMLGIAWTSRYLALLALAGYFAGYLILAFVVGHAELAPYIGFNFVLVAMAIGGIFTVPSKESFYLAVYGAGLCAIFAVAIERLLLPYGLPVLTMPFVLTSLLMLAGLSHRHKLGALYLSLQHSDLPEASYERIRLATARSGEIGSVPLLAPFLGQWQVYQGFNGPHTHQSPWQHALDFFMLEGQRSYRNDGAKLDDYYCFGATIVAPAPGQVVACRDDLPDNPPGEVDTVRNWGNYLLIRISTGQLVMLAHLRQQSLLVKEGDHVVAGQCLASCGNSGRSPQPHLHLHLQNEIALGSPTSPFHLSCVITREQPQQPAVFQIAIRPKELISVVPAGQDDNLAMPLRLPVGRCLYFRFRQGASEEWMQRSFSIELSLLGQFRLVSDNGASVGFDQTPGLLAFYDRQGANDVLLDMWILAMGLTPLTSSAAQWTDKPSARLLPLPLWRGLLLKLRPLSSGLHSQYQRRWDARNACWLQQGYHELKLMPGVSSQATTLASISPSSGLISISLQVEEQQWQAELHATGVRADHGVPAWVLPQQDELSTPAVNTNSAADAVN